MGDIGTAAFAYATSRNRPAAQRRLQELVAHQEFVVQAMTVGLDQADAEQLLVEWPTPDAEFILKAHIMGLDRDTAIRILADAPKGWSDWALEQAAIDRYRNPQDDRFRQDTTDWVFGLGYTADYAIAAERNRREAIASGRHREGGPHDWYASITWSRKAWDALHEGRTPRRHW
jgi:hypothetical protein